MNTENQPRSFLKSCYRSTGICRILDQNSKPKLLIHSPFSSLPLLIVKASHILQIPVQVTVMHITRLINYNYNTRENVSTTVWL